MKIAKHKIGDNLFYHYDETTKWGKVTGIIIIIGDNGKYFIKAPDGLVTYHFDDDRTILESHVNKENIWK